MLASGPRHMPRQGPRSRCVVLWVRYVNEPDVAKYLARLEAGELPERAVDPLDRTARRLESWILPLRTAAGVEVADLPVGVLDLARGERDGWWRLEGGRLRLTPRGFLHLDTLEERLARALPGP